MANKKPVADDFDPQIKPKYKSMGHWTPRNLRRGRKR